MIPVRVWILALCALIVAMAWPPVTHRWLWSGSTHRVHDVLLLAAFTVLFAADRAVDKRK